MGLCWQVRDAFFSVFGQDLCTFYGIKIGYVLSALSVHPFPTLPSHKHLYDLQMYDTLHTLGTLHKPHLIGSPDKEILGRFQEDCMWSLEFHEHKNSVCLKWTLYRECFQVLCNRKTIKVLNVTYYWLCSITQMVSGYIYYHSNCIIK